MTNGATIIVKSIILPSDTVIRANKLFAEMRETAAFAKKLQASLATPMIAPSVFASVALIKQQQVEHIRHIQSLFSSIQADAILPTFKFELPRLFVDLPDFSKWRSEYVLMQEAADELTAGGNGFMVDEVSPRFLLRVAQVQPQERQQFIVRSFAAMTYTPEFAARLESAFHSHPLLYEAWYVVGMAYYAHCEQKHPLSIPVFMMQTERLFTKLGEVRGDIYENNGTFYSSQPDRNGNPVRLAGLHNKMDAFRNHQDTLVADLIDFFLRNAVSTERNPVLHGNRTDYGTEEMSTRWLWVLYLFARELQVLVGTSGGLIH